MRNDQKRIIVICLCIDGTLCVEDKKAINIFKKKIKNMSIQRKKEKWMTA